MRSRLLRSDDEAWASFLVGTPHDFYHLPGYAELCARQERGEPTALLVEDGVQAMLLPLIVRSIAGGGRDAASPYGYPGPLLSGTDDPAFLSSALSEGVRLLGAEGIVSLFVRMHPLLDRALPQGVGTVVRHGDTVAVDLSLSEDVLWSQTRRSHRKHINRCIRAGYRFAVDADPVHHQAFRRLYRETMERVGADDFYLFDDAYFDGLQEVLGDSLHLATVGLEGDIAAAGLFVETSGIVQMHLSGTDERFVTSNVNELLYHGARGWAKDHGDRWLHMGGGRGAADDSLLHFKTGFSPLRQPYHTLRVVVLEEEYLRLSGTSRSAEQSAAFFPAYRGA